ncbi:hypothetical protein GCM10023183_28080 [Nibribacter koreensis]|uniref:DUF2231 domain-containing protein n=1 Tax=Nibribacter koreensis TaxID=1084519 RepID=A0ABP8FSU8_9BACT
MSIVIPTLVAAHGGEKHGAKTAKNQRSTVSATSTNTSRDSSAQTVSPEEHAGHLQEPATLHATPEDFPNKHPLIVHFPIVLLLVAAAVSLANVLFLRKELDWIVTVSAFVGAATAFYATKFAHPHTAGLTDHAQAVLAQHDLYADWTVYLGIAGLLAQAVSQFLLKGKRWTVLAAALILAGAAYAVAMAGHYGAQLVHIEGVGPQGRYLETEHHD